jgi:hypothetical protein
MTIPQLHPRSIAFIIFCTVSVLAVGLVGLYPNHRTAVELEKQLADVRAKLANQQLISPVYRLLLEKAKPIDSRGLDIPANTAAGAAEIDHFSNLVGELATKHNMVVERVAPDSKSYEESSNVLRMNVVLDGDFFDFRQMLIDLGSIAYVKNIAEIRIETEENRKKFSVRLLLNQK